MRKDPMTAAAMTEPSHRQTRTPRRRKARRDDVGPDDIVLDLDDVDTWAPRRFRAGAGRPGWRGAGVLVLLVVLSLASLGLFVATTSKVGQPLWDAFLRDRNQAGVPIGGVTLGQSPAAVRDTHPNLALAPDDFGDTVGAFQFEGAVYNVWFAGLPAGDRAYRIQYTQDFLSLSEAELLGRMRQRYGPPVLSECRSAGPVTRRGCHVRWWVGDNQALDAVTRTRATGDGGVKTTLTMTLIDTDLEARRVHILPAAGPDDDRPDDGAADR